ncbi:MAG: hypothetical protein ACLQVL_30950 [Terriglobia bacterium]
MHRESGATMAEHHGWNVPSFFTAATDEATRTRESVGLADVSWVAKFDLQGRGLTSPPGVVADAFSWELGRLHYLLTCEPPADGVRERLQQILKSGADQSLPPPLYVTEVTSVYAHLLLAGPRSRDVLSKLTSLNVSRVLRENLTCAQTTVAHVHAIILRKDLSSIPAYHLLVSREYGESVWESVLHAGHEFHIAPFGLEAQQLVQG